MTGGPYRAPAPIPSAYQRFVVALGLLNATGFDSAAPARLPRGFAAQTSSTTAEWHLRAAFRGVEGAYIELSERLDTRLSYPEPWDGYEYLIHLELRDRRGRNVSVHKDLSKPRYLRYHWHDYPDGRRRSQPTAMEPVSLRWFLAAAWILAADPVLPVPDLLATLPPPGPGDPW